MDKTNTFENSMSELEDILAKMSEEALTLDESIAYYAKAAELIVQCNAALKDARVRVEEIGERLEQVKNDDEA